MKNVAPILIAVALLAGCAKKEAPAPTAAAPAAAKPAAQPVAAAALMPPPSTTASPIPLPAPGSQMATPAPPVESAMRVSGKVLEVHDAAGYTYLRLATPSGEKWAAVAQTPAKVGESITINAQMVAEQFESKSLKRKFDKIIFGTVAGARASTQLPPGHPPTTGVQAPVADLGNIKVEKADGGKTIAEIWASRAESKDKEVIVRGKVVKFLPEIMGKNWLHLRDGSGSRGSGDDDLTVTTKDVVAVGDVVIVKGKLAVDKDFGAGYRYPVIVEDAKVTK